MSTLLFRENDIAALSHAAKRGCQSSGQATVNCFESHNGSDILHLEAHAMSISISAAFILVSSPHVLVTELQLRGATLNRSRCTVVCVVRLPPAVRLAQEHIAGMSSDIGGR